MIKKLAELAKEEGVVLDYYIGPDNAMTITVFAEHSDYPFTNPLSFRADETLDITKDIISSAKDD